MSRICEYYYIIDSTNGSKKQLKREEFSNCIEEYYCDFLTNDIYSIKKVYKLKDKNVLFYMTLFTAEYNFNSKDYIEHYISLPEDTYGAKLLTDFDTEIIEKFNQY